MFRQLMSDILNVPHYLLQGPAAQLPVVRTPDAKHAVKQRATVGIAKCV